MVGCFSWCSGPYESGVEVIVKSKPAARTTKGSKEVSVTPTAGDYAREASVDAIKIIQTAMGVVGGVPGAQQVLELALVLIQTCEDIAEVEEKVSILKDRIGSIMLVMVKGIEGKESATIPQGILNDIEKLGTDMEKIKQDLDKIAAQSRLLTVLFRNANKAKIESCMDLLKDSLIHWQISRDISNGVALHNMQQGIERANEQFSDVQKSIAVIQQAHTAQHSSSRQMPPKPTIFYGRDTFVEDIVEILLSTTAGLKPPRVCIHGPAGMGKTSAAIAVMEHPDIVNKYSENDRFWVPCISATSPEILLQILYSNLRISRDTGDYLADIIAELRSSPVPRLVLLDNFETPWDTIEGNREAVENVLRSLSELSQLSILVTMRTNIPPSEQIEWVDKPLDAGKPKLPELLRELGHMPFAITLVATLGKTSKSTPDELLKDWRRLGPEMLSSNSLEDSISRSIGLSMKSKQLIKNAPARNLLAALSMLPAGTTHSYLNWWVPGLENKKKAAISALNNVALVVDTEQDNSDEVLISVLPVVQSYMQQRDRIPAAVRISVREACYKFVLEHKSSPGDPKFKDDLLILSSEELNIQAILLEATRITDTITPRLTSGTGLDIHKGLEVLIAFCWSQHWTRPRTEVIEHTLNVARKAGNDPYIAESLFCLGSTFFRLDRYEDARQCYIEARDYFKKLSNIARASECSFELADAYLYTQDTSRAEQALDDVSEWDIDADEYVKARKKEAVGILRACQRQYAEALEDLNAAKEAFGPTNLNRPVDAASCLYEIARVLTNMGMPLAALQPINQSMDISMRYGPDNHLLETLVIKSAILLRAGSPNAQVLEALQVTFQKCQELGLPLAIAQTLECFGEVYANQRDVSSAEEAYKAAQTQYESMGNASGTQAIASGGVDRCQYNRHQLTLMQEDLEAEWNGKLRSVPFFALDWLYTSTRSVL